MARPSIDKRQNECRPVCVKVRQKQKHGGIIRTRKTQCGVYFCGHVRMYVGLRTWALFDNYSGQRGRV